MKLKFDSELDYQKEAINSIVDIFKGQPLAKANFTVANTTDIIGTEGSFLTNLGVGNKLTIDEEDILKNVKSIQLKNGLPQSKKIKKNEYHFTVEMETGERVIIVMGAIFVIKSRVSETLNKYISCTA
ncbi:hypothetical protein [Clostridium cochlearium]|uniref:hypothetical protein n=1 Tax=Clostridium cochlearium TaxID=1494 RepID=UPI001EDE13C7|nr:hypothetical protein [Clostridium cochlearium]MBV1818127.1 hypothetical protein [Bacteroidales bacterium MSK.15.36]MCG4580080.1 hypothetical protein [Clostridium cochlearium]